MRAVHSEVSFSGHVNICIFCSRKHLLRHGLFRGSGLGVNGGVLIPTPFAHVQRFGLDGRVAPVSKNPDLRISVGPTEERLAPRRGVSACNVPTRNPA